MKTKQFRSTNRALGLALIVFVAQLAHPIVASATPAQMYITPGSGSYVTGASITVAVRMNTNGDSVNTVGVKFQYDTSKLTFQSLSGSSSFEFAAPGEGASGGVITISRGSISGKSGDVLLGNVIFTAKAAGVAPLSYVTGSGEAYRDSDSVNIFSSFTGGSFTITNPAPPPPPPPPLPPTPTPNTPTTVTSGSTKPKTSPTPTPAPAPAAPEQPAPTEEKVITASLNNENNVPAPIKKPAVQQAIEKERNFAPVAAVAIGTPLLVFAIAAVLLRHQIVSFLRRRSSDPAMHPVAPPLAAKIDPPKPVIPQSAPAPIPPAPTPPAIPKPAPETVPRNTVLPGTRIQPVSENDPPRDPFRTLY